MQLEEMARDQENQSQHHATVASQLNEIILRYAEIWLRQ